MRWLQRCNTCGSATLVPMRTALRTCSCCPRSGSSSWSPASRRTCSAAAHSNMSATAVSSPASAATASRAGAPPCCARSPCCACACSACASSEPAALEHCGALRRVFCCVCARTEAQPPPHTHASAALTYAYGAHRWCWRGPCTFRRPLLRHSRRDERPRAHLGLHLAHLLRLQRRLPQVWVHACTPPASSSADLSTFAWRLASSFHCIKARTLLS